jgi:hypothetical protein
VAALALLVAAAAAFSLRYGVEDVGAYLVPAAAALAILAGRGLAAPRDASRWAHALAWVGAATVVALPLVRNAPSRDLRTITAAADYGRDMLATLPPGALLVADGDDTFTLSYLQRVMGERTDVTIYDREGFVLRDVADDPGPPPAPGEPLEGWRERRLTALVAASVLGPSPRPVMFMSLPGAVLPGGIELAPYGILFRARPSGAQAPDDAPLWSRYREKDIGAQARRVGGPFAASVAGSYAMMRAEGALYRGDQAGAFRALDEAVATAPNSEAIRNGVGAIYGRLGRYARAIGEFEAAVAVKPASQRAWANLATARELAGDRAGAAAARSRLRALQAR